MINNNCSIWADKMNRLPAQCTWILILMFAYSSNVDAIECVRRRGENSWQSVENKRRRMLFPICSHAKFGPSMSLRCANFLNYHFVFFCQDEQTVRQYKQSCQNSLVKLWNQSIDISWDAIQWLNVGPSRRRLCCLLSRPRRRGVSTPLCSKPEWRERSRSSKGKWTG